MSKYELTNEQKDLLSKIVKCDDEGSLYEKGYIDLFFGDDEYRIGRCGKEPVSLSDLEELAGIGLLDKVQQKPHPRYRITKVARIAIKNNFEAPSPVSSTVVHLSGDFRGSNLNIASTLTNVTQSINTLPGIDEELKDTLKALLKQLNEALQTLPSEKAEDGEAVAWAAEALIEAVSDEKPNKTKIEITKDGLKKAAENIASIMPKVLQIATQIVLTVNQLRSEGLK